MKYRKINVAVSILIIILFSFIWFFCASIQDPIGDDILIGSYEKGLTYYLDDEPDCLGEKITTFKQVFNTTCWHYKVWTGRITTNIPYLMNNMLGENLKSMITALLMILITVLSARLVQKNIMGVLLNPLSLFIFAALMFWYQGNISNWLMWTYTCTAGFSLTLLFLYLNISLCYLEKIKYKYNYTIIPISLIGFLAGLSHELVAAIFGGMILYRMICLILTKKVRFTALFWHSGILIGFLVGLFAPGNWRRLLTQTHESDFWNVSYIYRLFGSIYRHGGALCGEMYNGVIIALILVVFLYGFIYNVRKKNFCMACMQIWHNSDVFIVGGILSITLWAVPAYTSGSYLISWVSFVIITLLKNITLPVNIQNRQFIITLLCIIILITTSFSGLLSHGSVTYARRNIIMEANRNDYKEIRIPCYDVKKERMVKWIFLDGNEQSEFETDYSIAYYGLHIKINEGKRAQN